MSENSPYLGMKEAKIKLNGKYVKGYVPDKTVSRKDALGRINKILEKARSSKS
ncbi:MAG: hypothetical protein HY051_02120 [Candidatus Aenigmarchaeota archaeon]|nr:hypothetical protein [Candidatus Aenigmarchaeota archaeon]